MISNIMMDTVSYKILPLIKDQCIFSKLVLDKYIKQTYYQKLEIVTILIKTLYELCTDCNGDDQYERLKYLHTIYTLNFKYTGTNSYYYFVNHRWAPTLYINIKNIILCGYLS